MQVRMSKNLGCMNVDRDDGMGGQSGVVGMCATQICYHKYW